MTTDTPTLPPKEKSQCEISRTYAMMTRERAVELIGELEVNHAMPDEVAELFEAGREWEALRFWTDKLRLKHPTAKQIGKQRAQADFRASVRRDRVTAIGAVIDAACKSWGVDAATLKSNQRGMNGFFTNIRRVIAKYCIDAIGCSTPELAYVLRGGSHRHSSVQDMLSLWDESKGRSVVVHIAGGYVNRTLQDLYTDLATSRAEREAA